MITYILFHINQTVFEFKQLRRDFSLLRLPFLLAAPRPALLHSLLGYFRVRSLLLLPLPQGLQCLLHLKRMSKHVMWEEMNTEYDKDQVSALMCVHCGLTDVSSVRSCWFKLLLSSRRDSRPCIFSSFSSKEFFRADSIFVSRILYLLKGQRRISMRWPSSA